MSEKLNHPAISDLSAMQNYPNARDAELQMLLSLVPLFPGCRVVDIQAAGGYLSDGVNTLLQGDVELVCIEPVKALNQRLHPDYRVVEDKIENWSSIKSGTIDIVLGLAGLHHSDDQQKTVNEAFRVLKPGGFFAVCDVIDDSAIASWLNNYVNQYNPNGHKGDFISSGEVSILMQQAGFYRVQETIENVPWILANEDHLAKFFKGLFGLMSSIADIKKAVPVYLNLNAKEQHIEVEWQLIYAVAQKP